MSFRYIIVNSNFDSRRNVSKVIFNTSRYGKHQAVIEFGEPVTEIEAVQEAEKWLSQPLTEDHFELVKDDLFTIRPVWEGYKYSSRGTLLGSAIYLERIIRGDNGVITLRVGS